MYKTVGQPALNGEISDTEETMAPAVTTSRVTSEPGGTIYTLHFSPFSLYSLMIRFALVIGKCVSPESAPNVQIKLVNLLKDENLSEEYLTQVNSRGQVQY